MRYLSVCSGIEAASVAWHPLGWRAGAIAEIEPFPSAVLAHHYPRVPNYGDITQYRKWPDADIDVLVGGTPCQSFSVAGLRKGLADPRGNLALTFLGIADRYRPEWLIWENVPGVLSQDKGRAFASILGGMAELGYHPSYRTLDAQYVRVDRLGRAVPQRRRRVFVVGNLRDWRRASAVLFEPESLSGNPAPRRETGQEIAGALGAGSKRSGGRVGLQEAAVGQVVALTPGDRGPSPGQACGGMLVAGTLTSAMGRRAGQPNDDNPADYLIAFGGNDTSGPIDVATARTAHGGPHGRLDFESETFVCGTLQANGKAAGSATQQDAETGMLVAHTLRAEGHDASGYGSGGGTPLVAETITANFERGKGARAGNRVGMTNPIIEGDYAVRRLTPLECERLQGFPDGYTAIRYRNKPAADGPRYKALGNSMAVNVMRWLGTRVQMISDMAEAAE